MGSNLAASRAPCASSSPAAAARSAGAGAVLSGARPSRHGAHARPVHRALANRSLGRRADGPWIETLEGADVCINLAGRSVNCRYNARNREAIYHSRIDTTRLLNAVIARLADPPRVWLNASTATIYRHALDRDDG